MREKFRKLSKKKKCAAAAGAFLVLGGCLFRVADRGYAWFGFMLLAFGILAFVLAFAGRALRILFCAAAVLCVVMLIILEIPIIRASAGNDPGGADYVIVLGAGVRGTEPSRSLSERLNAALQYLNENPDTIAVVSGGQGDHEDITEAECMGNWLNAHGIPEERILREDRATSTEENLRFSMELIGDDAENASVAVLSSEYHLYRAGLIAEKMNLRITTIPARTVLPILRLNYYIREAAGVLYGKLTGRY